MSALQKHISSTQRYKNVSVLNTQKLYKVHFFIFLAGYSVLDTPWFMSSVLYFWEMSRFEPRVHIYGLSITLLFRMKQGWRDVRYGSPTRKLNPQEGVMWRMTQHFWTPPPPQLSQRFNHDHRSSQLFLSIFLTKNLFRAQRVKSGQNNVLNQISAWSLCRIGKSKIAATCWANEHINFLCFYGRNHSTWVNVSFWRMRSMKYKMSSFDERGGILLYNTVTNSCLGAVLVDSHPCGCSYTCILLGS